MRVTLYPYVDGRNSRAGLDKTCDLAKEIEQCISKYQSFSPGMFPHNLKENSDSLASKFAPFFCTVRRIHELKQPLKEGVISDEWKQWKQSTQGEDIADIETAIVEDGFWSTADSMLQLIEPFVKLLGTLDVERFAVGDVCNWQVQALEEAKNKGIKGGGTRLKELEELIEKRWDSLFSPLHATSYIPNPRYFGKGQSRDKVVIRGWKAMLERYDSESANRWILREQLSLYWRLEGSLGDEDAIDCRDKMDHVAWWENFGFETPHLQTLAIKVLSQVSSVAACKEICHDNGFMCREMASTSGVERVEDLVFVQNNLRIHSQKIGLSCFQTGSRNANSVLLLEWRLD